MRHPDPDRDSTPAPDAAPSDGERRERTPSGARSGALPSALPGVSLFCANLALGLFLLITWVWPPQGAAPSTTPPLPAATASATPTYVATIALTPIAPLATAQASLPTPTASTSSTHPGGGATPTPTPTTAAPTPTAQPTATPQAPTPTPTPSSE